MIKYFVKRVLIMIPTLLGIILVVFFFLNYIPGTNTNSFKATGYNDELDAFFEKAGIEESFVSKYIRYSYNVFVKQNFNPPGRRGIDLNEALSFRLNFTLKLTLYGFIATFLIGIPLGIYSALYKNMWIDKLISTLSLLLSSIPSYCLTIFLVLCFSLWLKILPVSGIMQPYAFVMPTIVLAVGGISLMVRMTRSAVLDVLDQPYITALKAKGLRAHRILYVHVLKNSLIPIVSTLNNLTVQMLCSTLIVENFFSIPGLGAYLVNAVSTRNLYVVLGCVVVIAIMLMLFNIAADILCMIFNPKLRSQYSNQSKA